MSDSIFINTIEYRQYDDNYYVSADGDIYSVYSKKNLKHGIDNDGYHRVDIHSKHIKVHKLVYITWIGPVPDGMQINHIDDDKNNNNISNLYAGTQQDNIRDCIANGHRAGNIKYMTIYDKQENKIITFSPVSQFIEYCGHSCKSGSVKKFFNKNWFKKRYEIIEYRNKSVTTRGDECNPVEQDFVTCSKRAATLQTLVG